MRKDANSVRTSARKMLSLDSMICYFRMHVDVMFCKWLSQSIRLSFDLSVCLWSAAGWV